MLTFDGIDGERSLLLSDEHCSGEGSMRALMSQVDEDEMFVVRDYQKVGDDEARESDWTQPKFSGPSWADLMEKEELFQKYVGEEERRDRGKKIFVGGFTFDSLSTDEKEKRLEALFSCFMIFGDIVRTKVRVFFSTLSSSHSFVSELSFDCRSIPIRCFVSSCSAVISLLARRSRRSPSLKRGTLLEILIQSKSLPHDANGEKTGNER